MRILLIFLWIIPTLVFCQDDSVPVNKTLKDKPVPNYPDSNSIYMPPDTNAIYKEEQGYPDKEKKSNQEFKENNTGKDTIKIKKTTIKKNSTEIVPSGKEKTKVVSKKVKKKPATDTTGTGTKQDF